MSSRPLLSIVVPTYRGNDCLRPLVERIRAALEAQDQPFEIVFVNDCSPDASWQTLEALAAEDPRVRVIELLHNHGQPTATMCGLCHARGELVATMDDDLQNPPEELPKMIRALEDNPRWDAVVGTWPRDEGLLRDLGSWMHGFVDRLAHGSRKEFRQTSFRLMRRPVVEAITAHLTRRPFVGLLLVRTAKEVHNVEVRHDDRHRGTSSFRFMDGVRHVLTNFMYGTAMPLRWLARFGAFCAVLAAFLGVFYVSRWVAGYSTPTGWASTFLAVVFFGGSALLGIGLLGEYTLLLINEVRQPPRWSIRRVIDHSAEAAVESEAPPAAVASIQRG